MPRYFRVMVTRKTLGARSFNKEKRKTLVSHFAHPHSAWRKVQIPKRPTYPTENILRNVLKFFCKPYNLKTIEKLKIIIMKRNEPSASNFFARRLLHNGGLVKFRRLASPSPLLKFPVLRTSEASCDRFSGPQIRCTRRHTVGRRSHTSHPMKGSLLI